MPRKPTSRQIRSLLSKCAFNPNDPGPLRNVVQDTNPNYLRSRAIEFIKDDRFKEAIQLLILVEAYKECQETHSSQ